MQRRALIEQQHPVGEGDGREPVGDDDGGPLGEALFERSVDPLLDEHVDGARRIIEHEDLRVHQERTGDGDALALAAGQGASPFADDGVVALGQGRDEVVRLGGLGGGDHVVSARRPDGRRRCCRQAHREQEGVVGNETDVRPQADLGQVSNVVAIDPHCTARLVDVVVAAEQSGHGRLARAGAADERHGLPGSMRKLRCRSTGSRRTRSRGDVVELDLTPDVAQVRRIGPVVDIGHLVEDLEDALG
ncbi:MAG: hypothetical protein R2710_01090 [Acidimicrobiales bacterium]